MKGFGTHGAEVATDNLETTSIDEGPMTDFTTSRTDEYESTFGRITDENLAEVRERVGVSLRSTRFGTPIPDATLTDVRLWSWGIGDDNPLFMDPDYGAASRWQSQLAPPSIIVAMDATRLGHMTGLPGVHGMLAGMNWEWTRPIRVGDRTTHNGCLHSVEERENTTMANRSIKMVFETRVDNSDGGRIGRMEHIVSRFERRAAREKGSEFTKEREFSIPHQWTAEEIEEVQANYRREVESRRGAEPRYWEDVQVGDEIPPIQKGPLSITSVVAFTTAVRPMHLTMGHRILYQFFDRHPGGAIPNGFGVPEPAIAVHWSPDHARLSGLPTSYDFGMERACWAFQLFTDWMGDDAFLGAARVTFKGVNYYGDLTTFTGQVLDKMVEGDLHLVRCGYESRNQRGELTTKGQALVALPSREHGNPDEEALAALVTPLHLLPESPK